MTGGSRMHGECGAALPGNPAFRSIVALAIVVGVVFAGLRVNPDPPPETHHFEIVTIHRLPVLAPIAAADLTRHWESGTGSAGEPTKFSDVVGRLLLRPISRGIRLRASAVGPRVPAGELRDARVVGVKIAASDPLLGTLSPGSRADIALNGRTPRILVDCVLVISTRPKSKGPTQLIVAIRADQLTAFLSAKPTGQLLRRAGRCIPFNFGGTP